MDEFFLSIPYITPTIDYEYITTRCEHFSLKKLCAEKLIKGHLHSYNVHYLPQALKEYLMMYAVCKRAMPVISVLLNSWKSKAFVLRLPSERKTWFFCNREDLAPQEARKLFWTFCEELLTNVMGLLKHFIIAYRMEGPPLPMHFFDLREVPTPDEAVYYLCNFIVSECIRSTNSISAQMQGLKITTKKFTVKVNCILFRRRTVEALCMALSAVKSNATCVDLIITGLFIQRNAVCESLLTLFALLDPRHLERLVCDYYHHDYVVQLMDSGLGRQLQSFNKVILLEVSCTNVSCVEGPDFVRQLRELIQSMLHLRELDLSNCRLTDNLKLALEHLPSSSEGVAENRLPLLEQLECLSIVGCRLSAADVKFLSSANSYRNMIYLNLSYNTLPVDSFISMLDLSPNLHILELSRCCFNNENVSSLFAAFSGLHKLQYLNIKCRELHADVILKNARHLARMARLESLLAYYSEPYSSELEYELSEKLQYAIRRFFACPDRPISVVFSK